MIEKLDLKSPDLVNANIEKLAALFPNCVTETAEGKAIDFDLLKQELSYAVVEGTKERYRLEWPGKKEAIVTANLPTTKTLRPVREDSVDFDNTENLYIEGDNLEVLKLLQESYLGKIKMIYIDPPYNTGKDFVYKDNFTVNSEEWKEKSGDYDEYKQRLVANPETAGRYHSDWLSMMYPRLKLARNLLKEDGVIFISIDDNEVHNLRKVCDEIFGEGNFVNILSVRRRAKSLNLQFAENGLSSLNVGFEYILCYAKSNNVILSPIEKTKVNEVSKGTWNVFWSNADRPTMRYNILGFTPTEGQWRWSKELAFDAVENYKNYIENYSKEYSLEEYWQKTGCKLRFVRRIENGIGKNGGVQYWVPPKQSSLRTTDWTDIEVSEIHKEFELNFSNPKSKILIIELLKLISYKDKNFLVLDFFSGSATTAHAVMQLNAEDAGNRKYIMVQLPEVTDEKSEAYKAGYKNICEIGKERIRRAAKSIVNGQLAMVNEKKAQLEKLVNGQLVMVNGKWAIPQGLLIDEKAENLLKEINHLQFTIDHLDTGFRVYRLDSSNMQDVYYRPQDYKQEALDLFADNVKPDRTPDDLLAQVMLDWGLPLSLKIEQAQIAGKQVFKVAEDSLYACFDKGIDEDFAKAIAQDKPLRIVFRDSGFKDDTAKTNVKQLLKQLSPETEMKVI